MRPIDVGVTMGCMKEGTRWTIGITPFAVGLGFTVVVIALVRLSDLPANPWLYIGVVVGILTALGGLLLAMARANEDSN